MKWIKMKYLILSIGLFVISCTQHKQGDFYENIGGLKLNYTVRGHGPIMVVGHYVSGKIGYQHMLKPLEEHFTMVYYEPRGTGKSEVPKRIEEYKHQYIVEEIEALRKHLNTKEIYMFGHSDQSMIALEYALKFPEKTKGLILSGTSFIGTQQDLIKRRQESEKRRAQESEWFTQVLQDWDYMLKHKTTVNKAGEYIADAPIKWWCYNEQTAQKVIPIAKQISETGRRKPIQGVYTQETKEDRQQYLEYQKQFRNIHTNILIVNGKYDTNNPPQYAKQLNDALPNSRLVIIDKAGHFPWVENKTETFNEIMYWLKHNT